MTSAIEAWMLVAAAATVGTGGMLLTLAAAVRRGVELADLEVRVRQLQAEQRRRLIERGLVEADEVEADVIEVEPVEDAPEPAEEVAVRRQAA